VAVYSYAHALIVEHSHRPQRYLHIEAVFVFDVVLKHLWFALTGKDVCKDVRIIKARTSITQDHHTARQKAAVADRSTIDPKGTNP
jgi:hypothetical protein